MADRRLSAERLAAGGEFLASLRALGLDPEGLFWAVDTSIDEQTLVLVTSFYEQVGPLEVNKLLFRAYNLSALPQAISPFIVRVHSPTDDVGRAIATFVANFGATIIDLMDADDPSRRTAWSFRPQSTDDDKEWYIQPLSINNTSLLALSGGLYTWREETPIYKRLGQWQRITRAVERLAA